MSKKSPSNLSIFKLYGLTYEEVKVIAPDFWLGEKDNE